MMEYRVRNFVSLGSSGLECSDNATEWVNLMARSDWGLFSTCLADQMLAITMARPIKDRLTGLRPEFYRAKNPPCVEAVWFHEDALSSKQVRDWVKNHGGSAICHATGDIEIVNGGVSLIISLGHWVVATKAEDGKFKFQRFTPIDFHKQFEQA